jgi:small subunit ribosomal protein S15
MALGSAEKQVIVSQFGRKEGDTGSPEVQIALLSKRISDLTGHLKSNAKDHSSRLGLLKLVGQRKRLMQYLKRTDFAKYSQVIKELGIRDK